MAGNALTTPPARDPQRRATSVEIATRTGATSSSMRIRPMATQTSHTPDCVADQHRLHPLASGRQRSRRWSACTASPTPGEPGRWCCRRSSAGTTCWPPPCPGHAGGPPLPGELTIETILDALERALDEAGFATAHIAGNSLGGYLALRLAARGRARSVVALAPAGGWAAKDTSVEATLEHFVTMQEVCRRAAPFADSIVSTPEGRRRATLFTTTNFEHIPPELLAHQLCGVAACDAVEPLLSLARRDGWSLDAERVACPVRVVWGTEDRLLPWPAGAARFRR